MINTIFYFADTENEYQEKWNAGEVSSRTIAFVKDSNKIFINGHDYIDRQSIIDQLVADAQLKDQALAETIRQELAAAQATLESSISDANNYAEGVHGELEGFKTEIEQDLSDSITAAITNAQGRTIWTELATTNEGLTAATNRINVALDANGNVKYTSALQSVINTGIDNNTAFTDIASRYAVLDENQDIISWMTSGFKGHTNDTESFAAMYAAANEATQNAIAQVKTEVTTDAAGKYVAKAGLSTEVQNIVDEAVRTNSLSYVASKSDVSGAESRMGAQYTTLNNALGTTNSTLSEVKTTADEGKARASLLTSTGDSGGYIINESALESSMVSIFNKSGDASAFIQQKATAAKDDAVSAATTLINTQASNAAATYATQSSLNNVNTTLGSYLQDADGNIIRSASLQQSIDADHTTLTSVVSDVTNLKSAGFVTSTGLDGSVAGLFAKESSTKSSVETIANNSADTKIAAINWKTNVEGVLSDPSTTLASKSYADTQASSAYNTLKGEVLDSDGKPKGVASLEQTVSDKIGENGSITTAITNLQTSVSTANTNASSALTQLANVDSKISQASNNLEAKLTGENGTVTNAISSLEQTVKSYTDTEVGTVNTAVNNLSTSVNGSLSTLSQNVSSNGSAILSLQTSVSGINSSIATLTQDVSANASNITAMSSTVSDLQTNQSQFYTASNLDAAVAGLMANANTSTGSKIATIEASAGVDFSTITLSADLINFEGSSTFQGAVNALDITAKNIKTTDANNVTTNEINSNGNGMLAKGGITWTVDGGLTLSQAFLKSLFEALGDGATNNSTYKGVSESLYDDSADAGTNSGNNVWTEASPILSGIWNSSTSNAQNNYINDGFTGTVLIYDTTNTETNAVNITSKSSAIDSLLDKVYSNRLVFNNGILVSHEKVDKYTHKNKQEMLNDTSTTSISNRIYRKSDIRNDRQLALNWIYAVWGKYGISEILSPSKYKGYKEVTWLTAAYGGYESGRYIFPSIPAGSAGDWYTVNLPSNPYYSGATNDSFIVVAYVSPDSDFASGHYSNNNTEAGWFEVRSVNNSIYLIPLWYDAFGYLDIFTTYVYEKYTPSWA